MIDDPFAMFPAQSTWAWVASNTDLTPELKHRIYLVALADLMQRIEAVEDG